MIFESSTFTNSLISTLGPLISGSSSSFEGYETRRDFLIDTYVNGLSTWEVLGFNIDFYDEALWLGIVYFLIMIRLNTIFLAEASFLAIFLLDPWIVCNGLAKRSSSASAPSSRWKRV